MLAGLVLLAITAARASIARAETEPEGAVPDASWLPAALLARAASPNPGERAAATGELAAQHTMRGESLLNVMLQSDYDPGVRAAAARALATTHNPEHIYALRWVAQQDRGPGVREAAASAADALMPFDRSPRLAAAFSVLCPGCGYFYLHQPGRAAAYLGTSAALVLSAVKLLNDNPTRSVAGESIKLQDHDDPIALPLLMATQNLYFYGIFAAYRDARLARGDEGYRFPVAKEGLGELLAAPFNPQVLKRPWVWAGLPLLLGAGVLFSELTNPGDLAQGTRTLRDGKGVNFLGYHYGTKSGFALGEAYNGALFLPVGVGEEALFRGVIQAGLSETSLGLWGGWAVASAIFGGAHVFNFIDGQVSGFKTAAVVVPYLMATGSYLGLIYVKTDFSLATGAAVHFWYDFSLSTIAFIADPEHQPFVVQYGMPF